MKRFFTFLTVILILTQSSFAQNYDLNLISKKTELNFFETKKRGIEHNQIIYFVEKDLQTISAYKSGKLLWQTNVISICGKPSVGKSEIRYIKYESKKLFIVFGKHSFAEIDIFNGNTVFIGSD
jgi:hypothetical protein